MGVFCWVNEMVGMVRIVVVVNVVISDFMIIFGIFLFCCIYYVCSDGIEFSFGSI